MPKSPYEIAVVTFLSFWVVLHSGIPGKWQVLYSLMGKMMIIRWNWEHHIFGQTHVLAIMGDMKRNEMMWATKVVQTKMRIQ